MKKLHERLPDSVTVNGREYKVDFDFRNVFRMMEYMDNNTLTNEAKKRLALGCIFRRIPRDKEAAIYELNKILFPERERGEHTKITDFTQDADLIRAAFWQVYGINLYTAKLHWLEFMMLLQCLPDGCRYCDVLSIRARPIPSKTEYNAEERERLIEAKARFAIEGDKGNFEQGARTFALQMLALANAGGGNDG